MFFHFGLPICETFPLTFSQNLNDWVETSFHFIKKRMDGRVALAIVFLHLEKYIYIGNAVGQLV